MYVIRYYLILMSIACYNAIAIVAYDGWFSERSFMKKGLLLITATLILGACTMNKSATENVTPTAAPTAAALPTPEPTVVKATGSAETTDKTTTDLVAIKTSQGTIVVKLYPETAPNTVKNFLTKAKSGFYKNLTFHRVVPGFVIQGGDPKGDGTGGGDQPTELSQVPFKAGSLGVARGGDIKVSNDAQFFICTETEGCAHLTGQYTNFGEVVSGMDVAKTIKIGDKIESVTLQ